MDQNLDFFDQKRYLIGVEASTLKLASSDTNESLADAEKFVMNQMIK